MEWFKSYFTSNFILILICLVMYVIAFQRYKQHKRVSICTISIISLLLILSLSTSLQEITKAQELNTITLTLANIGYILRPVCIYIFILMQGRKAVGKYFFLSFLPLIANALVYFAAYIPGAGPYIVEFNPGFGGGPLRYSTHVISAGYLAYLIYLSISGLKSRHFFHSITILACAFFVIIAVVIETFFNDNGDIEILNATVAFSVVIYYLFLYIEKTQIDTLTSLFNRDTYYRDLSRMDKDITGVIQYDMNGLKFINDNYGHIEGDKALASVSKAISESCNKKMYAYRLGGDEFIVLADRCSEEEIKESVAKFDELMKKTLYHCSAGYSYRANPETPVSELIKESEQMMYKDKADFYKDSPFERRHAEKA